MILTEKPWIKRVKLATFILLLFNATGALYGGYLLITDPSGKSLQLPAEVITHTSFSDYFFPGLILFIINGIGSLMVVTSLLLKWKISPVLVVMQGFALVCWIVIQLTLIDLVYFLHYVMGITGVLLISCGLILEKNRI
jgi:hypothetical protein